MALLTRSVTSRNSADQNPRRLAVDVIATANFHGETKLVWYCRY
jgi:hypothetical protein